MFKTLQTQTEKRAFSSEDQRAMALAVLKRQGSKIKRGQKLFDTYKGLPFFPIEDFKRRSPGEEQKRPSLKPPAKVFKSSGTTSDERSSVPFSEDGMFLYKVSAVAGFIDFLSRSPLRLDGSDAPLNAVTLIPGCNEWPDSSLAQMIEWFADFFNVTYLDVESLSALDLKKGLEKHCIGPSWIFGTAFHFVNLLDKLNESSVQCSLPETLAIETGGTKGKSRKITRKELYLNIHQTLGIPKPLIASEYGMSELASQAWSTFQKPETPWLSTFKFPSHVTVSAHDFTTEVNPGSLSADSPPSSGALILWDPLRVDHPHGMRTQDMITICDPDQNIFKLEGRVPQAVLKGCSLRAETADASTTEPFHAPKAQPHTKEYAHEGKGTDPVSAFFKNRSRSEAFFSQVMKILSSKDLEDSFYREFTSSSIAQQAYMNFQKDLPKSFDTFSEAISNSRANRHKVMLIQPRTHSLATVQPLVLAAALKLDVTIRVPDANLHILRCILEKLKRLHPITVKDESYYLRGPLPSDVFIVGYGSDGTINSLAKNTDHLLGFGHRDAAIVITESLHRQHEEKIFEDFRALDQKGCMSARVCFAPDSQREKINSAATKHLNENQYVLSLSERCAIDHYQLELWKQKKPYLSRINPNKPLVTFNDFDPNLSLEGYQAGPNFVFPFVFYKEPTLFAHWLSKQPSLSYVAVDNQDSPPVCSTLKEMKLKNTFFQIKRLGQLGKAPWDGTHEGRPLLYDAKFEIS